MNKSKHKNSQKQSNRKQSRKTSRKQSRKHKSRRIKQNGGGNGNAGIDWVKFNFQQPENNKWTIYGHSYCGYAQKAIKLLKDKAIIAIDSAGDMNKVMNFLKENNLINNNGSDKSDHTTSPAIFDGTKFIGGYDDLQKYLI